MDITSPRRVGTSRLEVTPLGFGGAPFGSPDVSNRDSEAAVRAAWEGGVRFFDTAPYYGIGRSERRLGMALAECAQREAYAVNTKVGRTLEPEPKRDEGNRTMSPGGGVRTPRDPRSGHRVHFDYSHDALLRQHRDSLGRMGLPYVDSLTIHDIDYGHQSWDQVDTAIVQLSRTGGRGAVALEALRDEGLIRAIGAGCNREMRNYTSWDDGDHEILIERLLDTVDLDFLILAGCYTLLDTIALERVLPLCVERGVGAIIASPYAGGWLVDPDRLGYMYGDTPDHVVAKSQALREVCERFEVPLPAVALQFPLAHPAVATVIPGAVSAAQAQAAQAYLTAALPDELWSALKAGGLLAEAAPTPAPDRA